jgi:hypothetical protein
MDEQVRVAGIRFKILDFGIDELKKLFRYNPFTGNFTKRNGGNKGKIVGAVGKGKNRGYVVLKIRGKGYLGHRLAWFYMTGEYPNYEVDHKNTIRHDNRWSNLREATHGQNQSNGDAYCNNKIGLKGVGATNTGRFRARIRKDGIEYQIGTFDTPEEAHKAYVKAAVKMHGEFARA